MSPVYISHNVTVLHSIKTLQFFSLKENLVSCSLFPRYSDQSKISPYNVSTYTRYIRFCLFVRKQNEITVMENFSAHQSKYS